MAAAPEQSAWRRFQGRLSEWARIERIIAIVSLGGFAIALLVTGGVLLGYYRPTAGYSHDDLKYLQFDLPFGTLMRNLHRHATRPFVVLFGLHGLWLVVVRLCGASPRWSWRRRIVAASLVCVLFGLPATGYLMPWDQASVWATTVGTNMARAMPLLDHEGPFSDLVEAKPRYDARDLLTAGRLVGGAVDWRFLVLHTVVLPLVSLVLIALWLLWWRREVRRA